MPYQDNRIGLRPICPMSAYSASPPVIARNTPPSTTKVCQPCATDEPDRMPWVEREQHVRAPQHARQPEHGDHHEPQQHHRSKDAADAGGSLRLRREQQQQDDQRGRQDIRLERICGDVDALQRAQHRDRRRDDPVAIDQRRAKQARPPPAPCSTAPLAPVTSAISARMPPSPWLSARITKTQYLIETVTISAQTTSDSKPNASSADGWPPDRPDDRLVGVERAGPQVAVNDPKRRQRTRRR